MTRHEQREQVFKLLFRVEFYSPEEMPEQMVLFFEDVETEFTRKDADYIAEKCECIRVKLPEIDGKIDEKAEGWNTSRMGKVELTIIRLAVYEILFDEQVPGSVAINEAVEIAKAYGQDNSGGFVNAILAKFV